MKQACWIGIEGVGKTESFSPVLPSILDSTLDSSFQVDSQWKDESPKLLAFELIPLGPEVLGAMR